MPSPTPPHETPTPQLIAAWNAYAATLAELPLYGSTHTAFLDLTLASDEERARRADALTDLMPVDVLFHMPVTLAELPVPGGMVYTRLGIAPDGGAFTLFYAPTPPPGDFA